MPLRNFVHAPRPLVLLVALALAACADQETPTAAPTQLAVPARPSLDVASAASPALAVAPASVTITAGRGITLSAVNVDPVSVEQANAPIVWSSSNPGVAEVSSTGRVHGVAPGVVTITASAMNGQFVATSTVTVAAPPNCGSSTPLPTNLTGIIAPIPPTYEDAPLFFRFNIGDPDACHGYTFRVLGVPVSGVLYQVAEDGTPQLDAIISDGTNVTNSEGWVAYYPKPGFNGDDSFRYNVHDEAGGIYQFLPIVPLKVLPVNDPPVAIPATHIGANNVAVTNIFLQVIDIDNLHRDMCISDLPLNGDLYWSSVAPTNRVAKGDCRPTNSLRYVSRIDGVFGCGTLPAASTYPHTDTFRWFVSDGRATSDTVTGTLRIDYVNHPPVYGGPDRVSTNEDTPVTFTPSGSDPDGNPFVYIISALPRHGALWVLEPGAAPRQITTVPTLLLADASGTTSLRYAPDADFNTLKQTDDFHLQLSDGDLLPTCDRTIRFDVASVNDAPTIVAPDRIGAVVALGGVGVPTGFFVSVADDARLTDVLTLTLRAQGPAAARVDLINTSGYTVQRVSATELRFQGTLYSINAVLGRGVQWTPNASGANYGELAIIVDDRGNSGSGGARVGTKIVAVDVAFETEGGLEGMRAAPATRRPPGLGLR